MHALDLPILRRSPSFTTLSTTLTQLIRPPGDFLSPIADALDQGTITWLTRLISSDLSWLTDRESDLVRQLASERLASECGRLAAPSMTRTFRLSVSHHHDEHPPSLDIQIHEPTLTADSLGLKTWSTSFLLSRVLGTILGPHLPLYLDLDPPLQSPPESPGKEVVPLMRGLELGSGTGLLGIALSLTTRIEMTVSDYLPEITDNLTYNTQRNGCVKTDVVLLDWKHPHRSVIYQRHERSYGLVVASDFMYDADHPTLIVDMFRHFTRVGGLVLAAYPMRSSNVDFIQTFKENMSLDRIWAELDSGQVQGYDDWGGSDPVVCHWHLFKRQAVD